jgi:hypothetical protein
MNLSYRQRRRPSRASIFFFLLALVFVGANYLLADEAHAAHNPDMTVEFASIEVVKDGRKLVVNYEISRQDWREMRRAGIAPRLNLHTRDAKRNRFQFAYSSELESRLGRIEYPRAVRLGGTRVVQLAVVGYAGFNRITQTRFGESCDERIRLRVRRGNGGHYADNDHHDDHDEPVQDRPTPTHANQTAAIIKACKTHSGSTNVAPCLKQARDLPRRANAVATIRACGDATKWASEFQMCMGEAKKIESQTAGFVAACNTQTQWNSELKGCLRQVADWTAPTRPAVVTACGDATEWNSEFVACLKRADQLGASGDRIIGACSQATSWDSEFRKCLDQAALPNRQRRARQPA